MARPELGQVLLSIEEVSLSFGGVQALSQVSLQVQEHEIASIIGPNGAGKSSLLNVINGFYQPQQGTITFLGRRRRRVRVHQAAAAAPTSRKGAA